MKWLVRFGSGLIVLAILGFAALQVFPRQIAEAAFNRAIERNIGLDATAGLSDGLHVFLCGTGAPLPSRDRAEACMAVLAGERLFLVDIGAGGMRTLGAMGVPAENIEAVYLTHLHSDHINGLGEAFLLNWVSGEGRDAPLPVIGPVGTGEVVEGFNAAYRIDGTYRTAHHGGDIANPAGFGGQAEEITLPAGPGARAVIVEEGDLRITVMSVAHAPVEPAFGYRIDYKDRSVSISGDTLYSDNFTAVSEGVDVMFHEALDPDMVSAMGQAADARGMTSGATIMADILDYHASPEDAARSAETAGAGTLVLYHLVPPIPVRLVEPMFLGDAPDMFSGALILPNDGFVVSLPAGSDRVETFNLLR